MTGKPLKAIHLPRLSVELFEIGRAYFVLETNDEGQAKISSPINEYNLASYVFDLTIDRLEGN